MRRTIYVVIDTYRSRFATRVLTRFSAHPDQIELVTKPSSSPQHNPVEQFWKRVRRNVTHTTFFQTIDRLLDAVTGFLCDMAAYPQTMRAERKMSRSVSLVAHRSREHDDVYSSGAGGA